MNKTILRCAAAAVAWLAACAVAPRGFAQGQPADNVDRFVQKIMREQKLPGLALVVVRDGKIVKAQGYGLANLELEVPVKPETVFQSGSMGKQFTATAVMMLVEEGKIALDDKISKYFPDAPETWKKITVRNLLSHTSGIKNYTTKDFDYRQDYTEHDLLKKAEALPLDFQPGEDWKYSNTGYVLLGILIHKVTGEFYGDFLAQRIFGPLEMKATRIISEADIVPNRAAGYRLVKAQWKNQEYVSASLNTTADGSLYFTVLDLAKWDEALYSEKLLKRSSIEQMWTVAPLNNRQPNKGNYGFGWFIQEMNGHRLIEHGGAWQGFTTTISRYVDDKLTVIVLTNLDSTHARPSVVAHGVAGLYVLALTPPPPPKPIEDKEPQVTALLKDVLQKLAAGNFDSSLLTPDAQKVWSTDHIKEFQEALHDLGALKSAELLSRKEENGVRSYRYRVTFEEAPFTASLRLTSGNKIAALDVEE